MKKLLILFISLGLITGCSNENPFARKDGKTVKSDKEEKTSRDKKNDDDDFAGKDKDYANSNWSSQQRDDWRDKCLHEYRDDPKAKQICSCILEKMERKYPDETIAKNVSENEADIVIEDCEESAKNGDDDNGGYIKTVERNDGFQENNKSWTNLQRQTFVQTCATAAQQQQGFTAQQANSYCDCMTRKVERKYTFNQASRLTTADLQTQEWVNAAAECRSRIY